MKLCEKPKFQQEIWPVLFLLVWALVLHYPFIYFNGAGEGDSYVLVNGIINGIIKQDFLYNMFLVFIFYSFGYYWLIFKLQPIFAPSLISLYSLINHLGFICGVLTTIPLYLFLKDSFGRKIAFYSVLIYHLTPTIFETSTYGHPVTAAWLCMTTALCFMQRAVLSERPNYLLGIATLITTLAMTMRTDVFILTIPLLLALLYYHNQLNKQWLLRIGILILSSLVLFSLIQYLAIGVSWNVFSPKIFLADINKFHVTGSSFLRPVRGLTVLALALGPLAAISALISFIYLYREQRRVFVLLAGWTLPIVIFWLPFPTPSRHFFYAIPGLIVSVVYLLQAMGKRYLPLIVCLFLALNYFSPLLLYNAVISVRPQVGLPEGQKQVSFSVPLLPLIENHYYLQKEVSYYWKKAEKTARIKDKSVILIDNLVLPAISNILASQPQYEWSGRKAVAKGSHYNHIRTPNNEYFLVRTPYGSNPQETLRKLPRQEEYMPYKILIFPETLKQYPDLKAAVGYEKLFISNE